MIMSRVARKLSQSGLYHISFCGTGKEIIFKEAADFIKMKEIIARVKGEMFFEIYAYCIMDSEVNFFIKERESGDISKIMTKILSHYATWFNRKYNRIGAVFYNRYKSEPAEEEQYYPEIVKYIHRLPEDKKKPFEAYTYSSYREYIEEADLTDIDFLLDMILQSDK